jgi:uncharacterized protein (DUF2252 family)
LVGIAFWIPEAQATATVAGSVPMSEHDRTNGESDGTASVTEATPGQREARRLQGKALRQSCPRASHAGVVLGQGERDPLALIEESNRDRLPALMPIRFRSMVKSSFDFFRGSAILQAHDLKGTPSAGLTVQCCGDCHLLNFGGYATPERELVFDIVDFDETLPAPFEWDVKRLATSFVLTARWLGFGADSARRAAEAVAHAYRTALAGFAERTVLETWYAKITLDDLLEEYAHDPKVLKMVHRSVAKAMRSTPRHVFEKLTTGAEGPPRIADKPPLRFHPDPSELDLERDVRPFFESYRDTLPRERGALFDRFRIVDGVYMVVGVGSVGTRCFVFLFQGDQDDPLFLQVKEARPSVLDGVAGHSAFANNGERIVIGQRLMQSASDIFLGWSEGMNGRNFYVRQWRDVKIKSDLNGYTPRILAGYGQLCGRTLARAHAKAGEAASIAGYLGTGTAFDEAIADYALAYADQVEEDYKSFRAAVRAGRFPIKSPRARRKPVRR